MIPSWPIPGNWRIVENSDRSAAKGLFEQDAAAAMDQSAQHRVHLPRGVRRIVIATGVQDRIRVQSSIEKSHPSIIQKMLEGGAGAGVISFALGQSSLH
jgi:hypothetical protein